MGLTGVTIWWPLKITQNHSETFFIDTMPVGPALFASSRTAYPDDWDSTEIWYPAIWMVLASSGIDGMEVISRKGFHLLWLWSSCFVYTLAKALTSVAYIHSKYTQHGMLNLIILGCCSIQIRIDQQSVISMQAGISFYFWLWPRTCCTQVQKATRCYYFQAWTFELLGKFSWIFPLSHNK